ncbi:RNA-directed DNA polymerase, eukaryota, reverse transcriptase zinc-binding domain protein [Tanacetum coccineum]|uniref:RNA-directed DNA polymerase, eukaryota, reverse transcriptase zinc-binding domain protein n=1 Tax=Tanacetum coccineum TaxID=301880 RepID=A0ABQ5H0C8_9ASTR
MGHWSEANIDTILRVLDCFYHASGLRINMLKSKLMGISVSSDKVDQAAKKIGCAILQVPFSYLGSKVGCLMSRIQSWSEIVNNILTRLSKWKLKTLSIGGRLTLLKSVLGSLPIYHMSLFKVPAKVLLNMESIRCHFFNGIEHNGKKPIWVKWNKVLASKEKGGLGVSSFYALNRALLFKWVWRFCTQQSALWTKIIKGIHGEDGKIGKHVRSHHPSLWLDIVKEVQHIQRQGTDLMGFIHRKMGNGVDIRFWEDKWRGDNTFQSDFPRMYALETQKNISVALKLSHDDLLCSFRRAPRAGAEELQYIQLVKIMEGITLFDSKDRWRWSLEGCGEFTVASVRNLLDANSLPVVSSKTRWIKAVPIKVNIHAWKVKLDILPTRLNISKRGMDIESILCPLCEKNVESSSHIFFTCPISREIFRKVLLWWEIDVVMVSSYDEWLEWLLSIRLHSKHTELFEGVCYVLWWYIWNFRNKSIFGSACPSKALIFEEVNKARVTPSNIQHSAATQIWGCYKILKDHHVKNAITTSATVPQIYIKEFWNMIRHIEDDKNSLWSSLKPTRGCLQVIMERIKVERYLLKAPGLQMPDCLLNDTSNNRYEEYEKKVGKSSHPLRELKPINSSLGTGNLRISAAGTRLRIERVV